MRSLFCFAGLVLLCATAQARELERPVGGATVISDGLVHRILVDVGDVADMANKYIEEVELVISLPGDVTPERRFDVQVFGVTGPWGADADWERGWDTPGGDFDEDVFTRTTIAPQDMGGRLRIRVDEVVREAVQGGGLYGLLVTVPPHRGRGFSSDEMEMFANVSSASLDVTWSPRPPRPPRREQ